MMYMVYVTFSLFPFVLLLDASFPTIWTLCDLGAEEGKLCSNF